MIANTDGGSHGGGPGVLSWLAALRGGNGVGESLDRALEATRRRLLEDQHPDGYWVGELEGDTILESEYILLLAYLGRERTEDCAKIARYIYEKELPGGGWAIYPGGPVDLSGSVKAYFALKLVGVPTDDPVMERARRWILELGGAQACNSFTRFSLALLGQMSYDECPCVPPELALVPARMNFSLYAMSSWTRTILVPLSILSAFKPVRPLPPERGVAELFRDDLPRQPARRTARTFTWTNFFLAVDRGLKWFESWAPAWLRKPGISAAHRWMLEHFEDSDGLGAIFPPMISTVIALDCLGYDRDSTLVRWALNHLEDLCIEEGETIRLQPCVSPVWDTAIATIALADAKLPDFHPALLRAARWLLRNEVRTPGDWQKRRPGVEPGGWFFQFQNAKYPDIDDTAMVLLALHRTALADDPAVRAATRRGIDWMLAMQNRDGGWAAFDADIDNEILTKVPFADHNAMLDPSCADITARVLEVLGGLGHRADHPAVARALDYLWRAQEPQGCWYGRWGVNYIYGTWQVLLGLRAIDFPMDDPRAARAADWLESVQQADGGWGESCASYDDPTWMGQGAPTASQTAWAVLGLLAAGRTRSQAVRRGVQYLLDTQQADGTWDEDSFTGTGFPRVFYLRYHLYRVYFPLMALARYRAAAGRLTQSPHQASRIPALPRPLEI
ncbi:MAG TPA: squalene--hopene cyclase [Isosphaeraceae bacterium]|jgi:squalene-hopene/tetraprenyl-beta-curcumene cyclase|nr:squalene--hopene cyclase [Isosphaeraceae bacterium]